MQPEWLRVTVHTNAGKNVLVATGPGRLAAWVKTRPVDGRANDAVIALLARSLDIPAGAIHLVRGARTRQKLFKVIR